MLVYASREYFQIIEFELPGGGAFVFEFDALLWNLDNVCGLDEMNEEQPIRESLQR